MERLLVWHSSKFAEPHFTVEVPDVETGALVLHILAQYDLYQGEERVASNAQGLCVWNEQTRAWDDWEDADGQDIDTLVAKGAIAVPIAHAGLPLPTTGE